MNVYIPQGLQKLVQNLTDDSQITWHDIIRIILDLSANWIRVSNVLMYKFIDAALSMQARYKFACQLGRNSAWLHMTFIL